MSEDDRVGAWRALQFLAMGFDMEDALNLSERTDVDMHKAFELIDHGCDPDTALRILL